jgi:hypothetical protein
MVQRNKILAISATFIVILFCYQSFLLIMTQQLIQDHASRYPITVESSEIQAFKRRLHIEFSALGSKQSAYIKPSLFGSRFDIYMENPVLKAPKLPIVSNFISSVKSISAESLKVKLYLSFSFFQKPMNVSVRAISAEINQVDIHAHTSLLPQLITHFSKIQADVDADFKNAQLNLGPFAISSIFEADSFVASRDNEQNYSLTLKNAAFLSDILSLIPLINPDYNSTYLTLLSLNSPFNYSVVLTPNLVKTTTQTPLVHITSQKENSDQPGVSHFESVTSIVDTAAFNTKLQPVLAKQFPLLSNVTNDLQSLTIAGDVVLTETDTTVDSTITRTTQSKNTTVDKFSYQYPTTLVAPQPLTVTIGETTYTTPATTPIRLKYEANSEPILKLLIHFIETNYGAVNSVIKSAQTPVTITFEPAS